MRSPVGLLSVSEYYHQQFNMSSDLRLPPHEAEMSSTNVGAGLASPFRAIVYVDGFNLYYGLKSNGFKRYYWLDVEQLSRRLLRADCVLVRVKYFTADIKAGTDKHRRQQTFLDALATHTTKLDIIRGRYLLKERQCRRCAHVTTIPEEKKTDVNIASHMLVDAFTDQFDVAYLVSGDSDLVPPIQMIKQYQPTKQILVAFPPSRQSGDLKTAAHGHFWINEQKLRLSQLPDPVTKPNGHQLTRPSTWR